MQSPALRPTRLPHTVHKTNQIRHRPRQSRRPAPPPYLRCSAQARPLHAQRSQHPLPHKRLISLSTHFLYNRPQQKRPDVRVLPTRPRRKIQWLPGDRSEKLPRRSPRFHRRRDDVFVPSRRRPVPSARMLYQIPNRNRVQSAVSPPRHKLRHNRPRWLIQPQPTFAHQNHRRRHRNRLRTARNRENSIVRTTTKATSGYELPIPHNRQSSTGNPVFR